MLRVALVGCGAVAERHYRSPLRKLEQQGVIRVAALVDSRAVRTAALRASFRHAQAYESVEAAYRGGGVDLSIIASPPGLHAEHVLTALRHGSHVLCEKPLATAVGDGARIVAAAHAVGRTLAVGMTRRFYPSLAAAREIVAAGRLGEDIRFVYREGGVYQWPVTSDAPFQRELARGGVLLETGSHALDFLSALLGPVQVVRYEDDAVVNGVEANCRLELRCGQARGVVQLSWNQPLADMVEVIGPAGVLRLDLEQVDALTWRPAGFSPQIPKASHAWPRDIHSPPHRLGTPRIYDDCFYYQLVQVCRAIVHGEAVPVSGEEALAVLSAIAQAYEMARPLPAPWLPDAEQEAAWKLHWSQRSP